MVCELAAGCALSLVRTIRLQLPQLLSLARDIAVGMHYLFTQQV